MNRKIILILAWLSVILLAASCIKEKSIKHTTPADGVSLTSVKMGDTISFRLSNGRNCQELVEVSATYPKFYKDQETTLKLQKLYISTVLEGNDSLSIDEAVKTYSKSILNENSIDTTAEALIEAETDGVNDKIIIATNITAAYHQNGIITFCKEEMMKKNDIPAKKHTYFNFDLETMTLIDLGMFNEESLGDVCDQLKTKLMEQNQVQSANALSELGYFNIDNMAVTANFCFDEGGITWSYLPQELAADANLEPKITLDYATLKQWASENSVLKRF